MVKSKQQLVIITWDKVFKNGLVKSAKESL